MHRLALLIAAAILAGCGPSTVSWDEFHTRTVTLPDGARIHAEVVSTPEDMARGMMYRDSLAADRGMLFIHPTAGRYPYWMHNVRIPLDIIWMDADRRVVEIQANLPGCLKPAEECPSYGGNAVSKYVLELAGGVAAKHGIKVGDALRF